MVKCCVCNQNIDGKPYPSPEGVNLCGEKCYKKWKTVITMTFEIKNLAHIQPKNVEDEDRYQRLENTVEWISRHEKQKGIEYIK